jgi:hypothetical protein
MNLMIVDKFLIPNTSGAEQTSDIIDFTVMDLNAEQLIQELMNQVVHTSTWLLLKILLLQALEYQLLLDKKSCYNT